MKKSLNQKGFTLIELLVVVAIIGILAATILASLGGARTRARVSRAQSEISSMRAAAELYYAECGSYDDATCGKIFSHVDSGMDNLVKSVSTYVDQSNVTSNADQNTWAFSATFSSGETFCADSNGFSGSGSTATTTSPFECN